MQRDFTVTEAALELGLSEGRVRILINDKRLKAKQSGFLYLIRESDLREFQKTPRNPGRPRKNGAAATQQPPSAQNEEVRDGSA